MELDVMILLDGPRVQVFFDNDGVVNSLDQEQIEEILYVLREELEGGVATEDDF